MTKRDLLAGETEKQWMEREQTEIYNRLRKEHISSEVKLLEQCLIDKTYIIESISGLHLIDSSGFPVREFRVRLKKCSD